MPTSSTAHSAPRRAAPARVLELSGLEVRPRPHQERILEALEAERTVHDRHRNLVVAATGTGKTVVAALDYRRLGGNEKSLLFVAHRKELLDQARRTYREVLGNGTFGELLVGGQKPTAWKHVFASVQSLREVDLSAFDVAVIDEFHHAEAPSYKRLLERLQVEELLGLTATPERADGVDVRAFFGGRVAVEISLGEALEQDLLCPFHYFGIADNTDLTTVEWKRGSYDVDALDRLYTGNDARTRIVLNALRDRITDVGRMRALGFCVSVAHANYMAEKFTAAGVPARAVTGETPMDERVSAAAALRDHEVTCLFTVDLYNEGVDLPFVDTVLFLRPTQSATIFLQQLGRGLRRAQDKAVLTVLDFIGQHRREFRFDVRYPRADRFESQAARRRHRAGLPLLAVGVPADPRPSGAGGCPCEREAGAPWWAEGTGRRRPLARRLGAAALPGGERARTARHLWSLGRELDGAAARRRFPDGGRGAAGGRASATGREPRACRRHRASVGLHATDAAQRRVAGRDVAERAGDGAHARLHDLARPRWSRLD